jgi:hypothetical protein
MNHYFKPKYECAIRILLAKLEVINAELSIELSRTVITGMSGRLKTWESIEKRQPEKDMEKQTRRHWQRFAILQESGQCALIWMMCTGWQKHFRNIRI